MLWRVQANIVRKDKNGWNVLRQIPTFFLDEDIQGIVSAEHAKKIAEDIINTFKDEDIILSINVLPFQSAKPTE